MDSTTVDENGYAVEKQVKHRKMINKSSHTNIYEEPIERKDLNV